MTGGEGQSCLQWGGGLSLWFCFLSFFWLFVPPTPNNIIREGWNWLDKKSLLTVNIMLKESFRCVSFTGSTDRKPFSSLRTMWIRSRRSQRQCCIWAQVLSFMCIVLLCFYKTRVTNASVWYRAVWWLRMYTLKTNGLGSNSSSAMAWACHLGHVI